MSPQHPCPSVELPALPPSLVGQEVAEELVSAVGWGVMQNDERAKAALDMGPDAIFDPYLRGLWVAIREQAKEKVFTWGLVRQRLLEGGMDAGGWQNALLIHQVATQAGYVGLWHIPGHREKLEQLLERRTAWDHACQVLVSEGVSAW